MITRGRPYPLGATWDGSGVNFAVFSEHASGVELCLFDSPEARVESQRLLLPARTADVWHGYVAGLRPGQLYGFRVSGPYEPEKGDRFNPNKLLLDPYAKIIGRGLRWSKDLFGYRFDDPQHDLSFDHTDSAGSAPLAAVVDGSFDWGDDRPPQTPWSETILYEAHVKGFTRLHPEVGPHLRGTYAGLASPPAVEHLCRLGITAIEILPVHQHAPDRRLVELGLSNYWGYNTIGFFAPDLRYAYDPTPAGAIREFKSMVQALHRAGIEVILDVVYNHTAEGDHLGPTLSMRGIDNRSYYRLRPDEPRYYEDFTGCGNTLDARHPRVLQLVLDSLRYWVEEMHVDGFRFDLAVALARNGGAFDRRAPFFALMLQDPVLSRVKVIAEPWDLGNGGYQVGQFPAGWSEWNGRYRDCVRRFWRGDDGQRAELATRLAGSSDLYGAHGRGPAASINFVTSHDGFTLLDLVSYARKHNAANGEQNADGEPDGSSWNCGTEGPSEDPAVREQRQRHVRSLLATLFLSQGVPMLLSGDEMGRTQRGNNNAYCQDNEISWLRWEREREATELLEFVRQIVAMRRSHPAFRRGAFFAGREEELSELKDVTWYAADGRELHWPIWNRTVSHRLAMLIRGEAAGPEETGSPPAADGSLLLLFNAESSPTRFALPPRPSGAWILWLDTAKERSEPGSAVLEPFYDLAAHSVAVLRLRPPGAPIENGEEWNDARRAGPRPTSDE